MVLIDMPQIAEPYLYPDNDIVDPRVYRGPGPPDGANVNGRP